MPPNRMARGACWSSMRQTRQIRAIGTVFFKWPPWLPMLLLMPWSGRLSWSGKQRSRWALQPRPVDVRKFARTTNRAKCREAPIAPAEIFSSDFDHRSWRADAPSDRGQISSGIPALVSNHRTEPPNRANAAQYRARAIGEPVGGKPDSITDGLDQTLLGNADVFAWLNSRARSRQPPV